MIGTGNDILFFILKTKARAQGFHCVCLIIRDPTIAYSPTPPLISFQRWTHYRAHTGSALQRTTVDNNKFESINGKNMTCHWGWGIFQLILPPINSASLLGTVYSSEWKKIPSNIFFYFNNKMGFLFYICGAILKKFLKQNHDWK